jgi:hypothetical protein
LIDAVYPSNATGKATVLSITNVVVQTNQSLQSLLFCKTRKETNPSRRLAGARRLHEHDKTREMNFFILPLDAQLMAELRSTMKTPSTECTFKWRDELAIENWRDTTWLLQSVLLAESLLTASTGINVLCKN